MIVIIRRLMLCPSTNFLSHKMYYIYTAGCGVGDGGGVLKMNEINKLGEENGKCFCGRREGRAP